MKKYLIILLALLFCGAEVSAKSFGGGSFRSSGFRSSTPSYKPSAPAKTYTTAPSKPSTFTQQPAAPVKPVTPTPVVQVDKSKASTFTKAGVAGGAVLATGAVVATTPTTSKTPNAIDSKLSKNTATTGKTFTSKADAESAYRSKLASQNTFTTSKAPSTRPEYIPQTVSSGGRTVNVVYHSVPGGGYGYGYYDPMTHMFMTLAATQMIMNASHQAEIDRMYYEQQMIEQQQRQLAHQQLVAAQQQQRMNQPVQTDSGHGMLFYILVIGAVIVVIIFIGAFILS
jgi:hypothetical protein